jgi:histidine triad (HIT) family protein
VFRTAARMAKAVKQVTGCQGVTLFQANEKAGAQTVFHFHIHVLPRWEDDGMALAWPAKNPPREALEEMAGKLRAAL